MSRIDPILAAAFENGMAGDQPVFVENADLIGKPVNLDDAPGAVGNTVIVAADGDETVMADAALQLEKCLEGNRRNRLEFRLLGGKGFADDALCGAVQAGIGDGVDPLPHCSFRS
jgi:hypothetical protein